MSDAKQQILKRVRGALRRKGPLGAGTIQGLEARMKAHPVPLKPVIDEDPVERFASKVQIVAGSVDRLPSVAGVSDAVLAYLEREGLERDVVMAREPLLDAIAWSNQLAIAHRPAEDDDQVSVTSAFAGVAETGTVVMLSAPSHPTTLNFLPETHIVVLERSRVVPHIEDVWARLRERNMPLPRTINMITGPSRTGDVELQLELGAHGPRRLHVILIDD
ncbi:MAG: LUD domain-containing protein [Gammaproteobacteria bacterium]|nr:LUD domain-containing protein [Gammaproteobacteria bacterium]